MSAFSTTNRLVLGQRAVDGKSNEIAAIPELLKALDLKGFIVILDARGCQREIAQKIVAKKADCILVVKGNRAGLHKAIQGCFQALDTAPEAMVNFAPCYDPPPAGIPVIDIDWPWLPGVGTPPAAWGYNAGNIGVPGWSQAANLSYPDIKKDLMSYADLAHADPQSKWASDNIFWAIW